MITPKESYLAQVRELRDAGKQLMHLFARTCQKSESAAEKQRLRKHYLEAELHVLRLEELLANVDRNSVVHG